MVIMLLRVGGNFQKHLCTAKTAEKNMWLTFEKILAQAIAHQRKSCAT